MARQRSKKIVEGRKANPEAAKPQNPVRDDSEFSDNDSDSDDIMEDDDENELARMVLGDSAGFDAKLGEDYEEESEEDGNVLGNENDGEDQDLEGVDDADLFFMDGGPSAVDPMALIQRPDSDDEAQGGEAAWEDSDDDRLVISLAGDNRLRKLRVTEAEDLVSGREYTRRLRRQFQRLNPTPEWASSAEARPAKRRRRSSASSSSSISEDDMEVDDEDLSTQPLARLLQNADAVSRPLSSVSKKTKLRPEVLDIQRTRDIPLTQPSAITSLAFHPQFPVLLSSGPASTIYLHHIAPTAHPEPNPLLTSVHIKHTPLSSTAFLGQDGGKIFFSGRRRYFHTWDLESGAVQKVTRVYGHKEEQKSMERFKLSPCGRYMGLVGSSRKGGGIINILDANTTQWIASARMEGKGGIADFAWWSNGEGLTVAGKGGEIGEWSVSENRFVGRWHDEGAVGTNIIALGGKHSNKELGGDRWIVVGSSSGVVNIYDRKSWVEGSMKERPEPTRRFMQLTTPTSCLEFSPDGQLLVISSKWKKDALRLIHLPSCTVYKNWPTSNTPLGRISAVAFSKDSDMVAVANEQGKIRLWEIRP